MPQKWQNEGLNQRTHLIGSAEERELRFSRGSFWFCWDGHGGGRVCEDDDDISSSSESSLEMEDSKPEEEEDSNEDDSKVWWWTMPDKAAEDMDLAGEESWGPWALIQQKLGGRSSEEEEEEEEGNELPKTEQNMYVVKPKGRRRGWYFWAPSVFLYFSPCPSVS